MNWNVVKDTWPRFSSTVRVRWERLTDRDLLAVAGSRTRLLIAIERAYDISAEDAECQVRAFEARVRAFALGRARSQQLAAQ